MLLSACPRRIRGFVVEMNRLLLGGRARPLALDDAGQDRAQFRGRESHGHLPALDPVGIKKILHHFAHARGRFTYSLHQLRAFRAEGGVFEDHFRVA
jgi:hypothetical protein